jgi:antitoxin MazE
MKVARWGNSLAIRIPADVAAALELKEGDDVEITVKEERKIALEKDERRARALARLTELAEKLDLPAGWKFDREEIYEERMRQLSK